MQNKHRFLFFSLAGLLVALLLSAAGKPVSGAVPAGSRFYESRQDKLTSGSEQGSPCMALLMDAATKAGVKGTVVDTTDGRDEDGTRHACHVRFDEGGSGGTFISLVESEPIEDSCNYSIPEHVPSMHVQLTTFHGYSAMITNEKTEHPENIPPYTNESKTIYWCMDKGGRDYYLTVHRSVVEIEKYGPANPLPIAEVLWSIAEDRLPLSEVPVDSTEQPSLPVDPGEVVPDQPELPTDETVPAETGGIFGIPAAIILGSLGIPVAGALAGAVVSLLVSLLGSSSPIPVAVPEPVKVNDLYWSERPWDEAGPGYVSKEEYERTKQMLEQGCKWTNRGGWQTPDQIKESNQWQQNNRAATARENAEWQAKMEAERQALEQNEAELKKTADELQAASNMLDLKDAFEAMNQDLLDQNIYVLNPYQGDPTLAFHRLNTVKNLAWDSTIGKMWTGSNGLTCEGYVEKTSPKILEAVAERFPGATVQRVIFEEKSTVKLDQTLGERFDSFNDDNHILTKIVMPDGSEWALDFHQHNAGNSPLLRPWQEARQVWKDYMGDEFMERVSVSETIAPRPRQ